MIINDRWDRGDRIEHYQLIKTVRLNEEAEKPLPSSVTKLTLYETLIPPREHLSRSAVYSMMDELPVVESFTDGKTVNTFLTFRSLPIPLSYFMLSMSLYLAPSQTKNIWPARASSKNTFRLDDEHYDYLARLWVAADLTPKARAFVSENPRLAVEEAIKNAVNRIRVGTHNTEQRLAGFQEFIGHIETRYAKSLTKPYVIDPAI